MGGAVPLISLRIDAHMKVIKFPQISLQHKRKIKFRIFKWVPNQTICKFTADNNYYSMKTKIMKSANRTALPNNITNFFRETKYSTIPMQKYKTPSETRFKNGICFQLNFPVTHFHRDSLRTE